MDSSRLKALASYNLGEGWHFMPVEKFVELSTDGRQKLLWQWATAKQMPFAEWKVYLKAHCDAYGVKAEQ